MVRGREGEGGMVRRGERGKRVKEVGRVKGGGGGERRRGGRV